MRARLPPLYQARMKTVTGGRRNRRAAPRALKGGRRPGEAAAAACGATQRPAGPQWLAAVGRIVISLVSTCGGASISWRTARAMSAGCSATAR